MIIKNSFIYLGTEVINKAIPFILLPIITKHLTPQEYGIYGIYQVILSFFTPFIAMSLDVNITRNFFKVSKEKLSQIISSVIAILHINLLVGLIVIFLISILFQNPFGVPSQILLIIPIIIFAQTINAFNLTILRNQQKATKYGMVQILLTIINFGSTLLLLLVFHKNWESLVYGVLISHLLVMIYSFFYLKNKYKLNLNFYPFKKIYKISAPLIFHLLGGSIIFLSDRVFIQQIIGLKEVGLYSIGSQFGIITMIIINAIIMAVNPWMYKSMSKKLNINKQIYILMAIFIMLGIAIWLFGLSVFSYIIDDRYLEAKNVIFWISLAFVFRGWYQLFYNIVVYYGKTNIFVYITFGSAFFNLILNYFLIHSNGIIGAAQATTFAFFSMFVFIFIYIKRLKYEKYNS